MTSQPALPDGLENDHPEIAPQMPSFDTATTVTLDPTIEGAGPSPRIMSALEASFAERSCVSVLDVGCGEKCRVRLGVPTRITGVDAYATHIERNPDLDERIVGDIDDVDFGHERHDLIVCWNVLEHLREPVGTIDRMIDALRPGGMLLLAWPNFVSVKAALARRLPHRVHEAVFGWLYPYARGKADNSPFPTVLDDSLRLDRIVSHVRARGVTPVEIVKYESSMQQLARKKLRLVGRPWKVTNASIAFLTGGRLDPQWSDVMLLLTRAESRP
jgi:SAM-dependent methyltransferase